MERSGVMVGLKSKTSSSSCYYNIFTVGEPVKDTHPSPFSATMRKPGGAHTHQKKYA